MATIGDTTAPTPPVDAAGSTPFVSPSQPPKAQPPPHAAHGRPRGVATCLHHAPRASASLFLTAPSTISTARLEIRWWWGLRRRLQGLRGAACRAHDTRSHEGVLAGLVVSGVHLVDGGDGAAASGELYTPASLHFTSSKEMLESFGCADKPTENTVG
jgi:hypothetical protein